MARLLSLHLYPIKSCRGITVDTVQLLPYGLAHDREWMVVHAAGWQAGTFITQRTHPRLAWVIPRLEAQGVAVHLDTTPLMNGVENKAARATRDPVAADILTVCSVPLLLPFTFGTPKTLGTAAVDSPIVHADSPLSPPAASVASRRAVAVWRDKFSALDAGDDAAQWFSTLLGCAVRVVRFDPKVTRLASATWTKGVAAPTTFADGFPILVANQASLDDLNARLAKKGAPPVPMERFRPNIVVADMAAYEEDYVSDLTFRIDGQAITVQTDGGNTAVAIAASTAADTTCAATTGTTGVAMSGGEDPSIVLRFVKPCARCPIPTFDQQTGRADARWPHEPLDTLMTYRQDARVDGVTFGINAIIINGVGQHLQRGMIADAEIDFDA